MNEILTCGFTHIIAKSRAAEEQWHPLYVCNRWIIAQFNSKLSSRFKKYSCSWVYDASGGICDVFGNCGWILLRLYRNATVPIHAVVFPEGTKKAVLMAFQSGSYSLSPDKMTQHGRLTPQKFIEMKCLLARSAAFDFLRPQPRRAVCLVSSSGWRSKGSVAQFVKVIGQRRQAETYANLIKGFSLYYHSRQLPALL